MRQCESGLVGVRKDRCEARQDKHGTLEGES